MIILALILTGFLGFSIGFVFCVVCVKRAESKAAEKGLIQINGELYKLTKENPAP